MRLPITLLLLSTTVATAHAATVSGSCSRDGHTIRFSDGIAFLDARDENGVETTTIYLTAKPLDRAALARCAECKAAPGVNVFTSPRGDVVEAQRSATAAGWMEIAYTGGELDMTTIVNLMYVAPDGTLTGLDGGNGHVELTSKDGKRFAGKVVTEARGDGPDSTDMTCDVHFDIAVGWPK